MFGSLGEWKSDTLLNYWFLLTGIQGKYKTALEKKGYLTLSLFADPGSKKFIHHLVDFTSFSGDGKI